MAQVRLRRLGYALGAEVNGLDLREPLDDATVNELRRAWLDHMVLCFPNQVLTKQQFVAFAGRFNDEIDEQTQRGRPSDAENWSSGLRHG